MTDPSSRLNEALAGRYTIDREIGRGGMASVYLAHDTRHSRPVALKVLHPQLAAAIGAERFLREIRVVARLRHPHIVPLYDSGEAGGRLYYVMPYVKGESVRQRLARTGPFSAEQAVHLTREIADALEYAHAEGVVHRDIKPDNIMLDERHAMITDFGIARAVSESAGTSLTETGLLVGTPAYMSPEQVTGDSQIDGRSDIYSLGCVLFEMLAGKPPFSATTPQGVMAMRFATSAPSLVALGPTTTAQLQQVVSTAMRLSREERYQTAREMLEALSPAPVTPKPDGDHSVIAGPTRLRRRYVLPVAAGALLVLAALLLPRSRPTAGLPAAADTGLGRTLIADDSPAGPRPVVGGCLRYADTVALSGTLRRETHPGPPNYESVESGDAPETGFYLHLARPICTDPSAELEARSEVQRVQLVLDSLGYARLGPAVGGEATIRGTLFSSSTAHHHAPLVMDVLPDSASRQ